MRDERIDLLRFLGLAMIVLAHVQPPGWLMQLRNFDVPLMVMVAGLSFQATYRPQPWLQYILARCKRLVLPVWLFLSIYFLLEWLLGIPGPLPDDRLVLRTYLLLDGIGYVWIIRVFLLVAAMAPLLYEYHRQESEDRRFLVQLGLIYLLYEALLQSVLLPREPAIPALIWHTVAYAVPYSLLFALGLRLPLLSQRAVLIVAGTALVVFVIWLAQGYLRSGAILTTQAFKYPPQSYYLAYAVLISCMAWLLVDRFAALLHGLRLHAMALFAGRNSIWIYLWHIPLVQVVHLPFWLKYVVVFGAAWLMTWAQVWLVRQYVLRRVSNPAWQKNLSGLLTG